MQHGLKISPEGAAAISGTVNSIISGNIIIGSVTANVDSIYIQSGANMTGSSWVYQKTDPWVVSGTSTVEGSVYSTGSIEISTNPVPVSGIVNLGSAWGGTGSVLITNSISVAAGSESYMYGVSGTDVSAGKDWYPLAVTSGTEGGILRTSVSVSVGSESFIPAGSVIITNPKVIGSYTTQGVTFSSGTGYIDVTQTTDPWVTSGTATVEGSVYATGSIRTVNFGDLGSTRVIDAPVTIGSFTTQGVSFSSGTGYIDVTQTTTPWVVSGTATVAGSVYNTGSVRIVNLGDLGSTVVVDAPATIGSYTTQNVLITSGTAYVNAIQTSNPWVVSGNVMISGVISNFGDLGSVVVVDIGSIYPIPPTPTLVSANPAWKFEYDANGNLGSVSQFIGAGSFVDVLVWAGFSGTLPGIGSRLTTVGSYS